MTSETAMTPAPSPPRLRSERLSPETLSPDPLSTQAQKPSTPIARLRPLMPALVTLAIVSVLLGIGPIVTTVTTVVPLLALPSAAGLPFLIPALHLAPLGDSTWAFWAVDTLAVAVMLVVAALRLSNSRRRHPHQGRVRRFFSAWAAVVLGAVVGNLLRGVFASFVVHADLATFSGYLLANILVSALFGALFGIIPALVAALIPWGRRAEVA